MINTLEQTRIDHYFTFMPMAAHAPDLDTFLIQTGFFRAPASTSHHGAYSGGLYDHSRKVAEELIALTAAMNLKWERPEGPYIVGMFHDLCKIDIYKEIGTDRGFPRWEYDPTRQMVKGHGDKSVIYLSQFMRLREDEILSIRYHMGAYTDDKSEWDMVGRAIERCPVVLFAHTADMIATRIKGV